MTTASGKYVIIEADTLAARRRQRIEIEDELKKDNLSPERRAELRYALREALLRENDAEHAANETQPKKKKEDEGDGSSDGGSSDGSGSSGDDSGSDGGEDGEGGGMTDFELFELLLFFVEMQKESAKAEAALATDYSTLEPLAAAKLLFSKQERTAQIDEPYQMEQEEKSNISTEFLRSLERHAADMGARHMHLKVHADAVELFRKKFGYEPHGTVIKRNGTPLQTIRKFLARNQPLKNSAN